MAKFYFILFVGQSKIGKTTLTKKIAQNFFEKKRFNYIFFCNLKSHDSSKKMSLFNFLVTAKNCLWMNDEKTCNQVLTQLLKNDKILLILDEFNEIKFNTTSDSAHRIGIYDQYTPDIFLLNILEEKILPKWKKIFVTRPFELYKIYEYQKQYLEIKVLGFDCKSQANLQLNENFSSISSDLQSFCFVPYICQLLEQNGKTYVEYNATTTTNIFAFLFLQFFDKLNKQYNGKLKLGNLTHFSWSQFSFPNKLRLCFDHEHRQSSLINDTYLNCFFTTIPGSSLPGFENLDYQFHFSHILMQEFLLALGVMLLPKNKFKDFFDSVIDNERFSMVLKFMFGFCSVHLKIQLKLQQLVGSSLTQFKKNQNKLKSLLKAQQKKTDDQILLSRYKDFQTEMYNNELKNSNTSGTSTIHKGFKSNGRRSRLRKFFFNLKK